jgi:hypothetical protein
MSDFENTPPPRPEQGPPPPTPPNPPPYPASPQQPPPPGIPSQDPAGPPQQYPTQYPAGPPQPYPPTFQTQYPSGPPPPYQSSALPYAVAPPPPEKAWWKKGWAIALGALVALVALGGLAAAFAGASGSDDSSASRDTEADENEETSEVTETDDVEVPAEPGATDPAAADPAAADPDEEPGTAPTASEAPENTVTTALDTVPVPADVAVGEGAADVESCVVKDADTIVLDVTNNSSEQSSYFIDINFLDASGTRLSDETAFIDNLRPGEHAIEEQFVFESSGATACEVAEVDRYASDTSNDVSEVTCAVTGVDFADDITTTLTATNGSSKLSDYFIDAALIRDGIRFGTATGVIENVKPGESAPGEGYSFVDGPVDGVTCETVSVIRIDSSD